MKNSLNKILFVSLIALQFLLFIGFLISFHSAQSYFLIFLISSIIFFSICFLLPNINLDKKQLLLIILAFLVIKIFLINIEPIGSDDYYRYIWDGKVQTNGINPYKYSPNDSTLSHINSSLLPEKVSYPNIKTIYFPVSQWLFTLSYQLTGENAIGLKIFYLLFEIITLISLYFLLKKFSIEIKYILIYAALPLITFQFFIDAHIDIAGAALMLLSITLYFYERKLLSYILLGLSVSVKPPGFLLVPFYFQNEFLLKNKLKSLLVPVLVLALTFLPYIFTATPIDTLINYSVNWTFNGMVYNALHLFLNENSTIRIICGILFLMVYVYLFFIRVNLINKIYLSLFLLLIFSPVAHPWYLIWFAVLLPVVRSYSGIYFVSAVSLTFMTVIIYQISGIWEEFSYILIIEYLPLLMFFFYEINKKKYRNTT